MNIKDYEKCLARLHKVKFNLNFNNIKVIYESGIYKEVKEEEVETFRFNNKLRRSKLCLK